jgi:hypothetical protein
MGMISASPHPEHLCCLLLEPTTILILSLSKDAARWSKRFATQYRTLAPIAWNITLRPSTGSG